MAVIGKVPEGKRVGNTVRFRAEIGDQAIIEKVLRGYLSHVSVQVDSDDIECSRCKRPTRKEGVLVHLCPGAYEIVHHPKVRELSIVASPAYKNTTFAPLGFAAAMNEGQWDAISQLLNGNKDVGPRLTSQGPEDKLEGKQMEVKHLSEQQTSQQAASPHKAQVVPLGEGESAPKQVTYEDLMNQVTSLQKQMGASDASDSEIETLNKKVAELEGELSKRAKKSELSRRIAELSKKLSSPDEAEEGEEGGDGNGGSKPNGPIDVVSEEASKKKGSGKGIVAIEEVDKNGLKGPDYDWFSKDLLKAASQLPGFK
jgi:flagellar motor protein MotB